jgi:hypothetical protein
VLIIISSQPNIKLVGKKYIWMMQFQVFGICYFSYIDNLLYWGLMITLIHDLIAFAFYFAHEENANALGHLNSILPHRWLSPSFFLYIFSIAASFSIAKTLTALSIPFIMYIFQMGHYLLEGEIWLRGSPHREHINLNSIEEI